jgi:arylsulfatase A
VRQRSAAFKARGHRRQSNDARSSATHENDSSPKLRGHIIFAMSTIRRTLIGFAAATALFAGDFVQSSHAAELKRPNIVFFLIDDLGWADVGCFGSKYYQTPNIDRLAKQGMRFTQAYAACAVCSPTRASIMTGKYPARLHLTNWIPGEGDAPTNALRIPDWRMFLPLEEVTIAEALKPLGYASASIGKWHLGGPKFFPEHQGFDLNVGGADLGSPPSYFWPYKVNNRAVPGLSTNGHEGDYLTDRLTDAAERFIEQNKQRPFFLYFPHYAVHRPLEAKKEVTARYKSRAPDGGQNNPVYAAMVESVDDSVGRVMRKLADLGLEKNTVVVFMSDNGGLWPQATSNAPLRAGKGYPYEGGIREPLIFKWPGVTKPGSVCATPVCSIDFFPTLVEIAGGTVPGPIDGLSIVPLLKQSGTLASRPLYWHYPHYWSNSRVRPYGVVRSENWKLVEWYEGMQAELYNLKDDPAEADDLAKAKPERVAELRAMLQAWRESVGAQMPTPNPEFKR